MNFINRKSELETLSKKWDEKKPHFFIVYGKRRVGKTELIKQFIKNKNGIYFLSDKRTEIEQLKELSNIIAEHYNDSFLRSRGFSNWLEIFSYIKERKKKLILAIDEYPYLIEANKAITSIFQKGWDEYLKNENVFLILCGSSISVMESEALIYKSPLYGRRTGQILLKPLLFKESAKFFPKKNFSDFLSIFTITGGIPAYLLQIEPDLSLRKNIERKIFSRTEFLHNEVEFILKEELREPKNYFAILKALSFGKTKFSEVANETGLTKNVLTKYLNTLERLQLIEKETPVTEKIPEKSRKGIYKISDNFFKFYFQFIYPNKSYIELENYSEVNRKLDESFNILESQCYEKVCMELVLDFQDKFFIFERIGRWWEKDNEIDIVATSSRTKEILFGEVKWSSKQVGTNILEALKSKAKLVDWNINNRKEYYVLFGKSGFTPSLIKQARKENVLLVHQDKAKFNS
ncbi:MAG: ATP-binding protein [Candidatus Melainabacteria bacterium]|nr:ATP-binding protein [Candidatus Melainabacteria bacterium]